MYKQYYDVGEKILKQLNSKLNQEELTIEELNVATYIIMNVKETRVKKNNRHTIND